MSYIKENLDCIRDNIKKYASGVNRDENDIILLAVTKTVDVNEVLEAINNGIFFFHVYSPLILSFIISISFGILDNIIFFSSIQSSFDM